MKHLSPLRFVLATVVLGSGLVPLRAQFSPGPNPINSPQTTAQTINSGTGTITSTGSLTLTATGGSDAVTMGGIGTQINNAGTISRGGGSGGSSGIEISSTANGITITNDGIIRNTGDGRAIRNSSVTAGLVTIVNNGTVESANEAAIEFVNSQLTLTNNGSILAVNGRGLDLLDMTSAASTITNNVGGIIQATGADGIGAGAGAMIFNHGTIRGIPVSGSGSDGIQTDENSGIEITNDGLIQGRHGITGGIADTSVIPYTITVHNLTGGQIIADNGSGLNIDGSP